MAGALRIVLAQLGVRNHVRPFTSPPLGLLYLAAHLRRTHGADIRILCQEVEGYSNDALTKAVIGLAPHVVGIGCMTPYAMGLSQVVSALRAALPKTRIILGGPHISAYGQEAFEQTAADAAVIGEGERSFEMYIDAVLGNGSFADIPGLVWRNNRGDVTANPGYPPIIEDLDDLPMPAYDLIDIHKYWRMQSMVPIPRQRYISLLSSRGCPFRCIWCHNIFGRHFRAHSPERMVAEIKHWVKQYNVNDIEFVDDCFNFKSVRVLAFAALLLHDNGPIKMAFPNAMRADLLDEATMNALVEAGLFFTCLALESGSMRIQKMTHKHLNIDKFLLAAELAEKRRVFTQGFMMLGFPTETEEEMDTTIRIASESRLHVGSFFSVTPYPNTPLFEYAKDASDAPELLGNVSNMDFLNARVNMTAVSNEALLKHHRTAMRKFYLRPDRLYRILRDFPDRGQIPRYLPIFVSRAIKGLLS